jgi:hypothetical protein
MKFKVGEKVGFLNEKGFALVKELISSHQVRIEDEHGFDQIYPVETLVKLHGEMELDDKPIYKDDAEQVENQLTYHIREEKSGIKQENYWELDLHIESLTEDHRGMNNFQIMKTQMQEFKRFFSKAKAEHIQKLVVIHGVGEGVLKNEIRNYLATQEFVEFFDASYLEYGKGATEIKILKY